MLYSKISLALPLPDLLTLFLLLYLAFSIIIILPLSPPQSPFSFLSPVTSTVNTCSLHFDTNTIFKILGGMETYEKPYDKIKNFIFIRLKKSHAGNYIR